MRQSSDALKVSLIVLTLVVLIGSVIAVAVRSEPVAGYYPGEAPSQHGDAAPAQNETDAVVQLGESESRLDFRNETLRVTERIACISSRVTPAEYDMGALYGCIQGTAETAKFFINEEAGTGAVKNIKVMWNDWFEDVGYGIHSDSREARLMVRALASLYAPELEGELVAAFFGNTDEAFELEDMNINYTYRRGPKIDERLLVLTPR